MRAVIRFLLGPLLVLAILLGLIGTQFLFEIGHPDLRLSPLGFSFQDEPVTGVVYSKHANGRIARLVFLWNGKKQFYEWQFYSNGGRFIQKEFSGGVPKGHLRIWHPDGSPKAILPFLDGKAHGEYWKWHRDGSVAGYAIYERGRQRAFKTLTPRKKVYDNLVFFEGERIGIQGDRNCDRVDLIR